jgi:hypothetical protein
MITFKTLDEILNDFSGFTEVLPEKFPPRQHLSNTDFIPSIQNVDYWEQIYYKKNYVGIYAAWNPYVEYYIIVFNLFLKTDFYYYSFFGTTAAKDTFTTCKKFGIELDKNFIFVEDIDYKNFTDNVNNTSFLDDPK